MIYRVLIIVLLLIASQSLYSAYYRRCRLKHNKTDYNSIAIADLSIEKVADYYTSYYIEPIVSW